MYFEKGVMGGTWPQREGILSALVPPERMGAFLATSPALIEQDMLAEMVEAMGDGRPARRRSSSGAGAWTRGPRATSPAGDPAT